MKGYRQSSPCVNLQPRTTVWWVSCKAPLVSVSSHSVYYVIDSLQSSLPCQSATTLDLGWHILHKGHSCQSSAMFYYIFDRFYAVPSSVYLQAQFILPVIGSAKFPLVCTWSRSLWRILCLLFLIPSSRVQAVQGIQFPQFLRDFLGVYAKYILSSVYQQSQSIVLVRDSMPFVLQPQFNVLLIQHKHKLS